MRCAEISAARRDLVRCGDQALSLDLLDAERLRRAELVARVLSPETITERIDSTPGRVVVHALYGHNTTTRRGGWGLSLETLEDDS